MCSAVLSTAMPANDGLITFSAISYEHEPLKPLLTQASFSVRRGAKLTLMGQNGAGKSTLFGLITGAHKPESGAVHIAPRTTIAHARQVIPRDELTLTVREFFSRCFTIPVYDIDPRIDAVLDVVHLAPTQKAQKESMRDRTIGSFSGGQQARLLLASALIQDADILLLDEPTNNLDKEGIAHLTEYLKQYRKTVLVISHDADFLNAFTHGVLYLNVQTKAVERYDGTYHDVVAEIAARVEKEKRKNAQMEKEMRAKKEKANYFAHKGGNLRAVAKRMREKAEEYEESKVEVRRDDKTIRPFTIPTQEHLPLEVLKLTSYKVVHDHTPKTVRCDLTLRRGKHLHIVGKNGVGKTTLLESLASGHARGEHVTDGVKIGYYRQDFSNLNFDQTVLELLMEAAERRSEEEIRGLAAGFLLTGDIVFKKVKYLSEGQKGLLAFARLVLVCPGLLILDEPTNHINFRHIPTIARALHEYSGALILVSHVPEFVAQVRIDETLDLSKSVGR